jgi:hypothetical protein
VCYLHWLTCTHRILSQHSTAAAQRRLTYVLRATSQSNYKIEGSDHTLRERPVHNVVGVECNLAKDR